MKELKFQINYDTLLANIEKFPEVLSESRSVFQEVRDNARKRQVMNHAWCRNLTNRRFVKFPVLIDCRFDTEEGVLVHGDFWSGK